jgi:hypothetical protein
MTRTSLSAGKCWRAISSTAASLCSESSIAKSISSLLSFCVLTALPRPVSRRRGLAHLHALKEQRVGNHDQGRAGHRERGDFGTEQQPQRRVEHTGGEREGNDVVPRSPPQVLPYTMVAVPLRRLASTLTTPSRRLICFSTPAPSKMDIISSM